MKHLFISFAVASLLSSCAFTTTVPLFDRDGKHMGILPKQSGRILYSERVNSGLSRSQFRHLVRQWLALDHSPIRPREIVSDSLFTQDVIVRCSFTSQPIASKGGSIVPTPTFTYTLVIDPQNGFYRVEIGNFEVGGASPSILTRKPLKGLVESSERLEYYNVGPKANLNIYLNRVNEEITRQISSLKTYLEQPAR